MELVGGGNLGHYAECIEVKLHPTFHPCKVKFGGEEAVRVKRIGWGTFKIEVVVHWKKEFGAEKSVFEHMLSFEKHTYKAFACQL